MMIRTSEHSLKFSNVGKQDKLNEFQQECRRVMSLYLDFLWEYRFEWKSKDGSKIYVMDIKNEEFDHPSMWSNVELEKQMSGFLSPLSARVKKCLLTNVLGKIGASLEKQRKRQYVIESIPKEGKMVSNKLLPKYSKNMPVKPNLSNTDIELSSICVDVIIKPGSYFDAFVILKSLGAYGKIAIPIKFHRQSNTFLNSGWKIKTSILLKQRSLDIRWEKEELAKKTFGTIVGADQGLKDILTLSNGMRTPKEDIHGHSFESILKRLSRKKKGSKAFKRVQEQRKNFIGWSINKLNLNGINQINLEKIVNINFGHNTSKILKHWTNTLIRDKVKDVCEKQGVLVHEQSSTYRSQRCSVCGMVLKSNRKRKEYKCRCGNTMDADLNASLNHEACLPDVPIELRLSKMNLKGFYWRPDGFYDLTGKEFTVPANQKKV